MSDYVSVETYGVDATKFYKDFNLTIAGVSRATGTCRESVSKVPIKGASNQNTEIIIHYLEDVCVEDYNLAIEQCKKEIRTSLKKLSQEWENYEKRERTLDEYRQQYNISRIKSMVKKVSIWNVLRCIKDL